jgi:hypothetical protein
MLQMPLCYVVGEGSVMPRILAALLASARPRQGGTFCSRCCFAADQLLWSMTRKGALHLSWSEKLVLSTA